MNTDNWRRNGEHLILSKTKDEEVHMLKDQYDWNVHNKTSSRSRILAQCLVTGAVMLATASCGMPVGFSAILLPQLYQSNDTMKIDEEIGSWIASIHSAATPFGSLLGGVLMDRYGRKTSIQIAMVPLIIGWILIAAAGSHMTLIVGRLIAGISVGLTAAPGQVLIGEISEPFLRGILSSIPFASYSFGILLIYALGTLVDWRLVAAVSIPLPLIAITALFFLPESPVWLLRKDHYNEAMKSLTWLRGGDELQAQREAEQTITRIKHEAIQETQSYFDKVSGLWKILMKPQVLKPFVIINIFNIMQILSGTYLIVFYAIDIISEMGNSGLNDFFAAVLTAGVRFLFTIAASILLAIIGRRPLALLSGLGTAAASLILGTFLYLNVAGNSNLTTYIPACCVLLYVAANTLGFMVLPGVMLSELYPAKVRGLVGGLTFMNFNFALFGIAKVFPAIKRLCGIHGIFWVFGGSSLLASIFLYLALPETKGRTLSQIEDYFLERNLLWITRDKEWERKNMSENQKA